MKRLASHKQTQQAAPFARPKSRRTLKWPAKINEEEASEAIRVFCSHSNGARSFRPISPARSFSTSGAQFPTFRMASS